MHLDAATGVLNHALDHVEANTGALDVVVETLEHSKQAWQVGWGQA
jgi:hypothetical protein